MKDEAKNLQLDILSKLHKTDFKVDMTLDLWHPDRKTIDMLFSLKGFIIRPNTKADTIYTVETKGTDDIAVVMFCDDKDATYLQTQIKLRREVNK